MQHTNTSSMSSGSTTCLFYRDLGARQLTTRSLQDISNGSETHRGERTYGHCLDSTAKKGRRIGEEPRFRIIRSEKGWECSASGDEMQRAGFKVEMLPRAAAGRGLRTPSGRRVRARSACV